MMASSERPAREVAHRVFAVELNDSTQSLKGEDQYAPTYVVTPTGAKVNRLFFVGVLTDCENIGQDGNELWRARISDPTGVFTVYAGQYQPEAAAALAEMEIPSFVAVVGKARTYEPEPGQTFVSVRPEAVSKVDEATRDEWILAAADQALDRLDSWALLRTGKADDAAGLEREGAAPLIAAGVTLARDLYGDMDVSHYAHTFVETMEALSEGSPVPVHQTTPSGTPTGQFHGSSAAGGGGGAPEAAGPVNEELEKLLVATVESLLENDGDGAPWDEVVDKGVAAGHSEEEIEEVLNDLMDKGIVYEPVLGKLKMT